MILAGRAAVKAAAGALVLGLLAPSGARAQAPDPSSKPNIMPLVLRYGGGVAVAPAPARVDVGGMMNISLTYRHIAAPRLLVNVEAGYEIVQWPEEKDAEDHGFAGGGPMYYQGRHLGLGYMHKVVMGAAPGGFSLGLRNSLLLVTAYQVIWLEVGHQGAFIGGQYRDEIRALLSVNFLSLLFLGLGVKADELGRGGPPRSSL